MVLHLIENFLTEIFWVYPIPQYAGSSQKGLRQGSSEYGHVQFTSVWLPESPVMPNLQMQREGEGIKGTHISRQAEWKPHRRANMHFRKEAI